MEVGAAGGEEAGLSLLAGCTGRDTQIGFRAAAVVKQLESTTILAAAEAMNPTIVAAEAAEAASKVAADAAKAKHDAIPAQRAEIEKLINQLSEAV